MQWNVQTQPKVTFPEMHEILSPICKWEVNVKMDFNRYLDTSFLLCSMEVKHLGACENLMDHNSAVQPLHPSDAVSVHRTAGALFPEQPWKVLRAGASHFCKSRPSSLVLVLSFIHLPTPSC